MTLRSDTPVHSTAAGSRRGRWRGLVVVLVLAGFLGLVPTAPLPAAQAADLTTWQPGSIISDSVFFDGGAMTAAQITAFIRTKGSNCVSHTSSLCLKDFDQVTDSKAADAYCAAYVGGTRETAAEIIAKVSAACRVNPQVLLVTLQKEQSLVTRSTTPYATYDKALGFACPDNQPCDTNYKGFFAQVYYAARQFQRYVAPGSTFRYQAGRVNQIQFNPKLECGSTGVFIENRATAALYNYTPYQPNAAALAAGYGTGDSCSAYGNRNFYQYFSDWFGSPRTQTPPRGNLESVTPGPGQVNVSGWAFDSDFAVPLRVHVYVNGAFAVQGMADVARPDVTQAYGATHTTGFRVTAQAAPGTRSVCVYAIDANRGALNPQLGCRTVDVPPNTLPQGALDVATTGDGTVTVAGWAFDIDTSSPTQVHVYLDGKAVRSVRADQPRPDVAAAYGRGGTSGYRVTLPATAGDHEVCTYAINQPTGPNPRLGCRTVFVDTAARGALDTATGRSGTLTLSGWAFDLNNDPAPVTVEIDVDGVLAGSVIADAARPDVARGFQVGPNHGYRLTVPFVPGTREVCVWAIDEPSGTRTPITCRSITVANELPKTHLDEVTPGPGSVTVGGWAFDPDTTAPLDVHVYVDGVAVRRLLADQARPDVALAYGAGGSSGFRATIPVAAGSRTVCVYAINWPTGVNPRFGCATVTVPDGTATPGSGRNDTDGQGSPPEVPAPTGEDPQEDKPVEPPSP